MTAEEIEDTRMVTTSELLSTYTFVETSTFKVFMTKKFPIFLTHLTFTLNFLLLLFQKVIENENLQDPTNTTIIVCSEDLRQALQVTALHYLDIPRLLVRNHLILRTIFHPTNPTIPTQMGPIPPETPNVPSTSKITKPTKPKKKRFDNLSESSTSLYEKTPHLEMSIPLLTLLSSLPHFPATKEYFTYQEVERYVCEYFSTQPLELCVAGNPYVFSLKNHPLRTVIRCDHIHRTQLKRLIDKHLFKHSLQ
jgi:hypothetical protein